MARRLREPQRLEELRARAREVYGTDDLDDLKRRLAAMESANETKRLARAAALDDIERRIAAIREAEEEA